MRFKLFPSCAARLTCNLFVCIPLDFAVKHRLADEDLVAVHTQLLSNKSKPNERELKKIHLFRFEGDKIVEYYNVTKHVTSNMSNASGAF